MKNVRGKCLVVNGIMRTAQGTVVISQKKTNIIVTIWLCLKKY